MGSVVLSKNCPAKVVVDTVSGQVFTGSWQQAVYEMAKAAFLQTDDPAQTFEDCVRDTASHLVELQYQDILQEARDREDRGLDLSELWSIRQGFVVQQQSMH
ncbi:hypothetical protein SAMN05880558_102222 [Aeromonas sp. RU39B]|uniref:hypothetical protein n=1 Tax=Aeromonas sp. RU39B TaxID=1907416 RepID=UPI0009544630|nr:hypothetical protein [Aeromonas sp. RU39B]SIQ17211.1 hypothetical protein SAMN05880558_102222 [Aeromonas sp. RU39B]